jgi:glycosyltransferase involved in cell wall biosynthesis
MKQQLISIIIPTYNYATYISRAIDSVLQQTYQHYEIIIIDDGSTDQTNDICQQYQSSHPTKFKYYYQDNQGPGISRNNGISQASGDFILCLDADDALLANSLELLITPMLEQPSLDAVIGGHLNITRDNGSISRRQYHPKALFDSKQKNFLSFLFNKKPRIANGARLVRRKVFDTILFNEMYYADDVSMFAHLLLRHNCITITSSVLEVHKHADSLRHNLKHYLECVPKLVELVFDPKLVPDNLMKYKKKYQSRLELSMFRELHSQNHHKQAKQRYHVAIKLYWINLFLLSYLRKYIKTIVASI